MGRKLPSRALRTQLMSAADERTVFDTEERTRPEVGSRGLANLASGDPGDPLGPVLRLVEAQAKALQLQQPFGALIDGLEIEDVSAGQVAAGAVHLVVAECPVVHGLDLPGDRLDNAVGLLGHRSGVDAKQPRQQVGRVGHAAADAVDQAQLVADDPAEPVGETGARAEDVVQHDQGLEIGMVAGYSQVAKHQVNLLAGTVDPAHPHLPRFLQAGQRNRRLTPGCPGTEAGLDQASQRSGLEVADGHEKRPVGPEIPAMVRDHIVAGQQPDIAQAASRISTQRVRTVDETPENQVGMTGRIFPVVLQLGQDPLLGPFDRAVGEDRLANQVSQ